MQPLTMPLDVEEQFGRGIRRAYEIQDGWSQCILPETPELEAELEVLREQEMDYRDRYDISRETIQRLMGDRPARRRVILGGPRGFPGKELAGF